MSNEIDKGKQVFLEEATELLAELEEVLLEMEENPKDPELVARAFRAMHTIKGSGAMFGFDDIAKFTHEIETIYDLVRENKMEVTPDLIVQTLKAHDLIQTMLKSDTGGEPVDEIKKKAVADAFKSMLNLQDQPTETIDSEKPSEEKGTTSTYRIRFLPNKELFASGTNPLLLLNELRELGECLVVAQTKKIPDLKSLNPAECHTYWDIILSTDKGTNAIKDVFIFVEGLCEIKVDKIDQGDQLDYDSGYKRLGEILIERGDLKPEDLEPYLQDQEPIGKILTKAGLVNEDQVQSALAEQKKVQELRENRKKQGTVSSIRVDSDKLDKLVDLVGELVTGQARLSQLANRRSDADLLSIAEEVERLTTELRDNTMSIRMLTIGSTFNKFRRLVRDLSRDLGHEVKMTTEGAETELDKTVIEQLNDPLVHIIRNSIDHGIEPPEVRKSMGKPREGTVHLSAEHSGANVLIRITDDGKGLDAAKIKQKAVDKGLVTAEQEMTDAEIFQLIFAAGFSTASTVTNVSGRGVGMDVVKKRIDALRGSVEIDSKKGKGTTITLKLPLTLAIIDGLMVKLGEDHFVLPLSTVEQCIELTAEDEHKRKGRNIINIRGEIIPYIPLREHFKVPGKTPPIQQVVVVEINGQRIGFVVDYVIGGHQTVIKNLGKVYKQVEGISGATILGDGSVALIIDVNKMIQYAEKIELDEAI